MTGQLWLRSALAAVMLTMAGTAAAQQTVSTNDIQRLQDQVFQASSELARLRSTDSSLASRLETELDDLRDEVIYLRVKLRREGNVNRTEYADLRDRLQELRTRARGESAGQSTWSAPGGSQGAPRNDGGGAISGGTIDSAGAGTGTGDPGRQTGTQGGVYDDRRPAGGQTGAQGGIPDDRRTTSGQGRQETGAGTRQEAGNRSVIPVGQEIDVRLQTQLSSDNAQPEDRFEATTVADLYRGNEVLIPAGSVLRGVISSVHRAGRVERKGQLTLAFDQITVRGRSYPMRGTVTQALESEGIRGEAGRIGAGAGVGAIIGGIVGGVRGALLGVLIGAGGTVAATEGQDVTLPAGTVLRVRLDSPPDVR